MQIHTIYQIYTCTHIYLLILKYTIYIYILQFLHISYIYSPLLIYINTISSVQFSRSVVSDMHIFYHNYIHHIYVCIYIFSHSYIDHLHIYSILTYIIYIYSTILIYAKYMYIYSCCCLVAKSCPTPCDPMDCSLPGSSVPGISQARILEWAAIHSLLQGIFLIQGSNSHLRHCRQILYH